MRDLSEFYTDEYLTESNKGNTTNKKHLNEDVDLDDLDLLDDDDFGLEEGYSGPTDEYGAPVKKRGKKLEKKKGKKTMKESFENLYRNIMLEEVDYSGDELDDDFGDEDFSDFGDDDTPDDLDSDTVPVSVSVLKDLISQLQGLVGDVGGDDDFDDEGSEYDDFDGYDNLDDDDSVPMESWDGGRGNTGMQGDYSGKAKRQGLNTPKGGRTGFKPNNTEGSTGDERLKGDYSGKAKRQGLNTPKGGRTGFKPDKEDLFG